MLIPALPAYGAAPAAERMQAALAAARVGDWRWDAASDCITLGARAAELLGLPAETALPWRRVRARLHRPDRAVVRNEFLHAYASHSDLHVECRLAGADGAWHWIALLGRADVDADQQRLGMTGMVQEISLRRSAEDGLRESEEALRALADAIPQLAWMAQADGAIVWFNKRWYDYTGTTPVQVVGWGWQMTQDPSVLPQMLQRWRDSLHSGAPFEMEYPIRGADDEYRWFLTRINPVRDRHGRVLRWFGTSTDVDQVKRVQQALRDESKVLELLNSTGNALATQRDLRSLLRTVTDAATSVSGARFGAFVYRGQGVGKVAAPVELISGAAPPAFVQLLAKAVTEANCRSVMRSGDVRADARFAAIVADADAGDGDGGGAPVALRSFLTMPVIARAGEVLGCLYFGHPEAAVFNARSERIVGAIAAQAAVAIDNTRLYEAASRAAAERALLLESERLARAEAERNSQMKDEFLATLSHELRTPLSAILGWVQVLRRGSRDHADLQRGLQTIERNARAQAQLIEDLLDMSRITSGKVQLDMQLVAPALFIDAAIDTVRPAADAKDIVIVKAYDAHAGAIAGDPARLQQAIWNLLSNAIKFTPRGGRVRVALSQADGSVRIAVQDSGVGIRADFMAHVFERFRQADASTTRQHGGLGLGLSIVKHLVEQHGGTVHADSAGADHGATFTIELPGASLQALALRAARAPSQAPAELAAPLLRDLSRVNVLVVDDEPDARELIKRILSDCCASVTVVASAGAALAAFDAGAPDVLVSDLGMPDVDGFELLARVRALGPARGGDVPAVALTAFARSEDRVRALQAGFGAHIAKPVEPNELIATVARMVAPPT
jgi:PAS domain S-box-containing protein